MQIAELGIQVDTSKVQEATEALDNLAKAADRARKALRALGKSFPADALTASIEPRIAQFGEALPAIKTVS